MQPARLLGMAYLEQVLRPHMKKQEYRDFVTGKGPGIVLHSQAINYRMPVT